MEALAQGKTMRQAPAAHSRQTLRRLYRYMIEYRGLFVVMLLVMLVAVACGLATPLVVEQAMNAIAFGRGISVDMPRLATSVALFVTVAVLSAACGFLQERISARITLNMSMRLRQDAFASISATSVSSFEGMRRGDLMSRMMNDAEVAAGAFSQSFREFTSATLTVVGCAAIMFAKCPSLAAVSVGTALVSVFAMGFLSRVVLPAYTRQQAALGSLNSHVEESLGAFRTCVSGGRTQENCRRMSALSRDYYERRLAACRLEYLMGPLMQVFGNLNFLATVVYGVTQIMAGTVTIGAMQAFVMYSKQFMEPLNALSEQLVRAQNALAGAERIFAVIDLAPETDEIARAARKVAGKPKAHVEPPRTEGGPAALAFEDVRFAYHRNSPVLEGVSLALAPGERLALVGKTGEGKTTLTSLLLLFFPAFGGRILVDGTDVRAMDCTDLRQRISVVAQEPQISEGTVYDNMTYGCEGATREEVMGVVRDLGIAELLERLPKGLDTELSGIGESMSQGELQLICLARALLRQSPILILDEATSSLDPNTEETVRRGMEAAMEGRTCILIAHRLSSVSDADHIAVLDDGRIAEYGTHRSLMAQGGIYKDLYQTQFQGKET